MPLAADNDNAQGAHAPRCPSCGKTSKPEFRPFCSGRCKDADLARWLSGTYAIPGSNIDTDSHESDDLEDMQGL